MLRDTYVDPFELLRQIGELEESTSMALQIREDMEKISPGSSGPKSKMQEAKTILNDMARAKPDVEALASEYRANGWT